MERNGQLQELFGMCNRQNGNYTLHAELIAFYLAARYALWHRYLLTKQRYNKIHFANAIGELRR